MRHPFLRPGFGDELLCFFSIVCPFLIYPYIVRIFGHPGKQVVNLVNDWPTWLEEKLTSLTQSHFRTEKQLFKHINAAYKQKVLQAGVYQKSGCNCVLF